MEDRLNQLNAVLQSMQKTLECNICLDLLNKPLTTKCGHSFCADCIHQMVKNTRNAAQCPLCMSHVTRRSLGQNNKITSLVTAVRNIITSIKKDCCFEVTPSKYRPKRRTVISCEEDDSENEENDEPRRGTRKREVTSHYNPEAHVPKPRARPAKQRILASNGGQELNLCVDGQTEKMVVDDVTSGLETSKIVSSIISEHSYSSPTKQEPHERFSALPGSVHAKGGRPGGAQSGRGRGKLSSAARGKPGSLMRKSANAVNKPIHTYLKKEKNSEDDLVSISQEAENTLFFREGNPISNTEPPDHLSEKLGQEKSLDKVSKWLHNSSEVGFRIGVTHSSESTTASGSESSNIFQVTDENIIEKNTSSMQESASSVFSSKKSEAKSKSSMKFGAQSVSESEQSLPHLGGAKFFKCRVKKDDSGSACNITENSIQGGTEDDRATIIYEPAHKVGGTQEDPYKFIPSQKTPNQKSVSKVRQGSKSRSRGSLSVSRGRVRGRGRGGSGPQQRLSAMSHDSTFNFGIGSGADPGCQSTSTPAIKGKPRVPVMDLSAINPVDGYVDRRLSKPGESKIVCSHDDVEEDYDIPDSCPVNTKDAFDVIASDVKDYVSSLISTNQTNNIPGEEDKEAALLFVTPAQGSDDETKQKDHEAVVHVSRKKEIEGNRGKVAKSKKESGSDSSTSSTSSKRKKNIQKSKAEKAKEEVEALCSLFDEVEDHQLSMISVEQNELQKKEKENLKDNAIRLSISLHNQTVENTELNKTFPSVSAVTTMPPPKAPGRNRKVKFQADASKTPAISGASSASGVSKSVTKTLVGDSSGRARVVRGNLRYGSDIKQKILEPGKTVPMSVNVRDAKSPGWSHVAGARKDLKTRHTSLNITGGEQRNTSDVKTKGGTIGHSSQAPSSSADTNVIIEDETQDFDVEHLQASQSKIELVKKLKKIVHQLKVAEGNDSKIPDIGKKELIGEAEENSKEEIIKTNPKGDNPVLSSQAVLLNCPTETEPFDCADIASHMMNASSLNSVLDSQSKKRKINEVYALAAEPVPSKTSKLTRKTFSLKSSGKADHQRDNSLIDKSSKEVLGNDSVQRKTKICLDRITAGGEKFSAVSKSSKVPRKTFELGKNNANSHDKVGAQFAVSTDCSGGHFEKKGILCSEEESKALAENISCNLKSESTSEKCLLVKDPKESNETDNSENFNNISTQEVMEVSSKQSLSSEANPPAVTEVSDKSCHPHHVISPGFEVNSQVSLSDETKMGPISVSSGSFVGKPKVIPFKAVGSLCSKRCFEAVKSAERIDSPSLGQDLCLHSVPCEVYQVLLKYMDLLKSNPQLHSSCCGNSLKSEECSIKGSKVPNENVCDINKSENLLLEELSKSKILQGDTECSQTVKECENNAVNAVLEKDEYVIASQRVTNIKSDIDSEIPNTCDTEELEMVIPLPLIDGIRTRSAKDTADVISNKKSLSKKTRMHKQLSKNAKENKKAEASTYERELGMKNVRSNGDHCLTDTLNCIPETSCKGSIIHSRESFLSDNNSSSFSNANSESNRKEATSQPSQDCVDNDLVQTDDSAPSSNEFGESQHSTSLLSIPEINNSKESRLVNNKPVVRCNDKDAEVEDKAFRYEKSQESSQRNKGKNISTRSLSSFKSGIDVEKENLENRNCLQINKGRPKRKPLQSGPHDNDNIISVVTKDDTEVLDEKNYASQKYQRTSQVSSKMGTQRSTNNRVFSMCDLMNEANKPERDNDSVADNNVLSRRDAVEGLDEGSPLKELDISNQRKFKRIRKPPSSSSSEDSDSECIALPRKRKSKVMCSSSSSGNGNSISGKVAKIENRETYLQYQQHQLDSEEMRDLERLDQKVWDYFGCSDKDLMGKKDDDQVSHVSVDDSSHGDEEEVDLIPSDEEIPSTLDVMRNVEADMEIIRKMRQAKDVSQEVVDLVSQKTSQSSRSLNITTLSVNTKNLFQNADKSVTKAEMLLDSENSLFENISTPSAEKSRIPKDKKLKEVNKKPKKQVSPDTTSSQEVESQVVSESEAEMDNISHSSAYSSQSEAISTQKHKEVQNEVEMLKARLRELEAAMKRKTESKAETPSGNIIGEVNQDPMVKSLPKNEQKETQQDSEEELFSSLPDFTVSTEPTLPPSTGSKRPSTEVTSANINKPYRVVCTGLNSCEMMAVDRFVKKIAPVGSALQKSWGTGITHVIVKTDKDMLAQRTLKYLYGVAAGCWVISFQWVLESASLNKILPEDDFEVLDCTGVPGPRRGRTYLKRIFENCEFFLKPPFVEVTIDQLKDLLELCGARLVDSPSKFTHNKNYMKVIIIQTDSKQDVEGYLKRYQKIGVSHDWIIECVGMHSHICIAPYIVGNPSQSHYESSGIPTALLEESQELTCSQL